MIAVGQAMPPGLVWVRRDVDPETGKEPEVLYTDDSGDLCTMSLDEADSPELAEAELEAGAQREERTESCFDKALGLPMDPGDTRNPAGESAGDHANSETRTPGMRPDATPPSGAGF